MTESNRGIYVGRQWVDWIPKRSFSQLQRLAIVIFSDLAELEPGPKALVAAFPVRVSGIVNLV